MMTWLIIIFIMLVGATVPLQAGVNTQLAKAFNNPIQSALISFFGGMVIMAVVALVLREPFPSWAKIKSVPPYMLTGGALGVVMVLTAIYLTPKLGATILISCFVAGQMIASLILDNYGWLGFPLHPISILRVVGVVLLIGGVLLVRFF